MKRFLSLFLLGLLLVPAQVLAFSDVEGHEYSYAIDYVESRGIVEGYDDGTFRPDQTITRAELTKILVEHLYDNGEFYSFTTSNCFSDVVSGEWFTKYVCFAESELIVGGYPDGTFKPHDPVDYVEALKIVLEAHEAKGLIDFGFLMEVDKYWYSKYLDFVDDSCAPAPSTGCLAISGKVELGESITRAEAAVIIQWIALLTQ